MNKIKQWRDAMDEAQKKLAGLISPEIMEKWEKKYEEVFSTNNKEKTCNHENDKVVNNYTSFSMTVHCPICDIAECNKHLNPDKT